MKKNNIFLFCIIILFFLTLLVNAEKSEYQIKYEELNSLAEEVSNYKNQLIDINYQNKKLFFEENLTATKSKDFMSSLENIQIQMTDDLYARTQEFVNEISALLDSVSNYNDYNNYKNLWHNASDLVYAEQKLISISLDQKSLIATQDSITDTERRLYNEVISIKLDLASLRLDLALR